LCLSPSTGPNCLAGDSETVKLRRCSLAVLLAAFLALVWPMPPTVPVQRTSCIRRGMLHNAEREPWLRKL
jgi:hypothetical protein